MYTYLVVAVVWGVVVAATGAFLTDSRSAWYREVLKKPSWQPPDWAFGPAWSVIFALAGWSFISGCGTLRMRMPGCWSSGCSW